jgi:hypothetical protein
MGCQCNKQNEEEQEDELKKDSLDGMNDVFKEDNNFNNKEEVFGLNNEEENHEEQKENDAKLKGSNNKNQPDEDYNERLAEEKNAKYGNYPEKMLDIINRIREDPASYADYIEDSIKNIVEETDKEDETKTKLIYKKKVKVALTRGEIAFREAAEKLRNMEPVPPLELNENIIIPLPETEEEIKDPTFLKEQVKALRENTNIDLFFKDLIKLPEVSALLMVVDDSVKNPGRKRQAILNKDFKYVGINSHFIGRTFVAYFAFSK